MRPVAQVAVIAAIIASLVYLPAAAGLALLSRVLGISLQGFATFGGVLSPFVGLLAWWLVAFAGACAYAFIAFPWKEKVLAWPKKS